MFVKHICPFPIGNIFEEEKQKLQIIGTLSTFKGHNSAINCSIIPKKKLDLDIIVINLYTEFHFSRYNLCEENEGNCK